MWAKIENGQVLEVITKPKAITVGTGEDAVSYGRGTVFKVWDDAERKAIDILPLNISNSIDQNLYEPQGLDKLDFVINGNKVDGSYPLVPKDTLPNLKADFISRMRRRVRFYYRDMVDDEYAEKYRVELDGGAYEISDAVKAYAGDLKANFASYKEAINSATDISSLGSISMVWPKEWN